MPRFPRVSAALTVLVTATYLGSITAPTSPAPTRADQPAQQPLVPESVLPADPPGVGADGDTPPAADPPPRSPDTGRTERVTPVSWSAQGIPARVLQSYREATAATWLSQPGCHLPMALLAAIGNVESGHARGGQVDDHGTTVRPILGPVLDGGPGIAAIRDTDGGRLDGNARWDRAVGPMQFIPSTWARWATDGNGDAVANPHNIDDASNASARYLCAGGRDLGTPAGLDNAILSYNHSSAYLRLVLAWMATYQRGTVAMPGGVSEEGPADPANQPRPAPSPPSGDPNRPPPGSTPPEPPPDEPTPSRPPAPHPGPEPIPSPPSPPPSDEPGVLPGVTCVVDEVIDTGGGLVGSLLPTTLPPISPDCREPEDEERPPSVPAS